MLKVSRVLIALLLALVLGSAVLLFTWEIPPPTAPVERLLPDDQFPR